MRQSTKCLNIYILSTNAKRYYFGQTLNLKSRKAVIEEGIRVEGTYEHVWLLRTRQLFDVVAFLGEQLPTLQYVKFSSIEDAVKCVECYILTLLRYNVDVILKRKKKECLIKTECLSLRVLFLVIQPCRFIVKYLNVPRDLFFFGSMSKNKRRMTNVRFGIAVDH